MHRRKHFHTPRPVDDAAPRGGTEWVSIFRLAERLDVRVDHLRALVSRREIPFGRVGRLVRFHLPTIQRWLLANPVKTTGARP